MSLRNSGSHPYIARFNKTTGSIIAINALNNTGLYDPATTISRDTKGNYYIGGRLDSTMTVGASTIAMIGSQSDFFVGKFGGTDCNFLATTTPELNDLKTYPNPVKDFIYLNNAAECTYQLYNIMGRVIESGKLSVNGIFLFQKYAAGVYILELESKNHERTIIKVNKQ